MKNRSLLNPFRWISIVLSFVRDVLEYFRSHVERSIRLQLILTFVFCLFVSFMMAMLSAPFFSNINKYPTIDYSFGVREIDAKARSILYSINLEFDDARPQARPDSRTQEQRIENIIERENAQDSNLKILIVDLDGKVLYKSKNATESQVDIHSIIRNAMENRLNGSNYQNKEYFSFYPVNLKDTKAYLVVSGLPEPRITFIEKGSPLPALLGIITFIFLFFLLTKRKMKYIEELAKGLMEISKGNLDYRVAQKSKDELGTLAERINEMTAELQRTIEEERRAEKTKNELITNVSHDLRTPLTLIMGYLRLLKDKKYENEQQAETYVNIAFNKSEKLKGLIDDLFEYTKLSNRGEKLNLEKVCLNELLEQLVEEQISYAEENRLSITRVFPSEKIWVQIDADQMIRVFDNLLTNAVKYSYKPGSIKVLMFRENGYVNVCISNRGTPIPEEDLQRLFDRFYRVDASRSSETGGSGLGLAIAKSIIDHHGGQIWAECEGEDIRFWVKLKLS